MAAEREPPPLGDGRQTDFEELEDGEDLFTSTVSTMEVRPLGCSLQGMPVPVSQGGGCDRGGRDVAVIGGSESSAGTAHGMCSGGVLPVISPLLPGALILVIIRWYLQADL